jgi:hypothetical protein
MTKPKSEEQKRRRPIPAHGTPAMAQRHYLAGEKPCEECRIASNARARETQRKRYEANPAAFRESSKKFLANLDPDELKRRRVRYRSTYRLSDPEKLAAVNRKRNLVRMGMTPESYADLLAAQKGCCRICGTDNPGNDGRFHIDHDHSCCPGQKSCGQCIRGLLCRGCNHTLGHARDNPETLRKAADYLESFMALKEGVA